MSTSSPANNASIPVNSHPLSPDEQPAGGRPPRRRTRGRDSHPPSSARPVTSYFTLKPSVHAAESSSSNGNSYAHHNYSSNHTRRTTVNWDGSVRGFSKRKTRSGTAGKEHLRAGAGATVTKRASMLSLVWDKPSVPLFIVGSSTSAAPSERSLTTPPGTPIQRPIFTLSPHPHVGADQTLHDLPARAASHVLSTPFHALSDSQIQSAISDLSVLSEEDNVSVEHPYHSALRVLSEAVKKLSQARVELEEGRRKLVEKQGRVREVIKASLDSTPDNEHALRNMLLSELDSEDDERITLVDMFASSADAGGQFSLADSLSMALSEDLTPTINDTHASPRTPSSVMSITPPDSEPPDRHAKRAGSIAPSLIISSESSGSIFTPDIDEREHEHEHEPVLAPAPSTPSAGRPRTKSRANSSTSLASVASSTSNWMGWFGKAHLGRVQGGSGGTARVGVGDAIVEDGASGEEESDCASADADADKPRAEKTPDTSPPTLKSNPTPRPSKESGTTMRLLSAFRLGSASPQAQSLHTAASPHKRKTSVNVTPSVLTSPILGAFTLPPPIPAPPVISSRTPTDAFLADEGKTASRKAASVTVTDGEVASLVSSGPHKDKDNPEESARMQGASLRALCNATRVMTSDPASILVDHGQDVGSLVKRLAWELVSGVRDGAIAFREPVRPKVRAKSVPVEDDEGAEVDTRGKSRSAAVSAAKNLSVVVGAGASALEKTRKTSALGGLASPLFGGGSSKSRASSTSIRDDNPGGPAPAAVGPNGASGPAPPGTTAGALSVPLESIIPATAKPPTQYLARTYTSLISPDFKPPTSFGAFAGGRFATRVDAEGARVEPITDRYGFVYEVSSYDVLLLDRALRAGNSAPGCLTGIKVADREEDDDWPAEDNAGRAREFEVVRKGCECVDGVRGKDQDDAEGRTDAERSEAASVVSTTSSKRSSKRIAEGVKLLRTVALSAPLKVASLNYLPPTQEGGLVPTHACQNTVRALVARITDIHDRKQAKLKSEWNAFLRSRRDIKPVKASISTTARPTTTYGGAAVMLGLGARGAEDDVEELRQSEGLVGFSQMGLASNRDERREFGRLVRGGIPLVYRAKVWLECSGALEIAEPGAFRDLLEDAIKEDGVAIGEIEKDVGRTMPLNVFFGGDGVGVDKLRRVLRAYSQRNPDVGYCQGMNLVASTLLLVHADEEDAFWNLACIIEKHLPEDFFSPSLLVSRACPLVLLDYVHDLMPTVFNHLTQLEVDLPAICFSWFLSLFTDCLPVETLFRVWDVFIVDGLDVLFRIALSILRINEPELLQADSVPALYVALESLPTRMWDVEKLLKYEVELRPYIVNADIIKKRNARVKELKDLSA